MKRSKTKLYLTHAVFQLWSMLFLGGAVQLEQEKNFRGEGEETPSQKTAQNDQVCGPLISYLMVFNTSNLSCASGMTAELP